MKSEDITKLPYAPWLEDTIREMTEHEVQSICIAVKVDGDAMLTGYWNADTQDKAMSAADVAPVVRCKDCRYLVTATVNSNGFLICHVSDMEIAPNDFCSYGERKE